MKRRSSFLWVIFVLFAALPGCSPSGQSTQSQTQAQTSALVRIECFNAPTQLILQLLRSGRGRDISVTGDASNMEITAAFSPVDTPPAKLLQILHDLNDLYGVVHVELVENPRPIKQDF